MSTCPYCDQEIRPSVKEKGLRDCEACGGQHRLMSICPAKPGLCALISEWMDGARSPMHWIAVGGITVLWALATLGLILLISG